MAVVIVVEFVVALKKVLVAAGAVAVSAIVVTGYKIQN